MFWIFGIMYYFVICNIVHYLQINLGTVRLQIIDAVVHATCWSAANQDLQSFLGKDISLQLVLILIKGCFTHYLMQQLCVRSSIIRCYYSVQNIFLKLSLKRKIAARIFFSPVSGKRNVFFNIVLLHFSFKVLEKIFITRLNMSYQLRRSLSGISVLQS